MRMLYFVLDTMAIRENDIKLISGHSGWSRFGGWYPPPQVMDDHVDVFNNLPHSEVDKYQNLINFQRTSHRSDYHELYYHSTTRKVLTDLGRPYVKPRPATIDCKIPKPENASENCNLSHAPCIYNITADPCEFQNLASVRPDLLKFMLKRLDNHRETLVHIRNKPFDMASIPAKHNDTWAPWVDNVLYFRSHVLDPGLPLL